VSALLSNVADLANSVHRDEIGPERARMLTLRCDRTAGAA
jgi:hypothetical protein